MASSERNLPTSVTRMADHNFGNAPCTSFQEKICNTLRDLRSPVSGRRRAARTRKLCWRCVSLASRM